MEEGTENINNLQPKWFQMSSSPLDLNKNVWDSPSIPKNSRVFSNENSIDRVADDRHKLPEKMIKNEEFEKEDRMDESTAGSVSSECSSPQPSSGNSIGVGIIPTMASGNNSANGVSSPASDINVWNNDSKAVDAAQNVWVSTSVEQSEIVAGDAETKLTEDDVETKYNEKLDKDIEPVTSDTESNSIIDPWKDTSQQKKPLSPFLQNFNSLPNNDEESKKSITTNNNNEMRDRVTNIADTKTIEAEQEQKEHVSAFHEHSSFEKLPNIFPRDLALIMDSIYQDENFTEDGNKDTKKQIDTILDYADNTRRYYNAFIRPTRQFLLLNSDTSDSSTNDLHHIVAWKNSSAEKEFNKIVSNWNNTENSSSMNSSRLKENAYITMFGWSTTISYTNTDSASNSNPKVSIAEHKETMKEKLTRLAELGANKLVKERLRKEADQREIERKLEEVQRNCNDSDIKHAKVKSKELLDAEREKNMLELQRLRKLAIMDDNDNNESAKKLDSDSDKRSKNSSKKLLPKFFGFNHNTNNKSNRQHEHLSSEERHENLSDLEFHMDDDEDTSASNNLNTSISSNIEFNMSHDSNAISSLVERGSSVDLLNTTSSASQSTNSLISPTIPSNSNNAGGNSLKKSKPLIPISVLQPTKNSVILPKKVKNSNSHILPLISTGVLQPKRSSMINLNSSSIGSPVGSISSSLLYSERTSVISNKETDQKSRPVSLHINSQTTSKADIFDDLAIFNQSPVSTSNSASFPKPVVAQSQPQMSRTVSAHSSIITPSTSGNFSSSTTLISNKTYSNTGSFSVSNRNNISSTSSRNKINSSTIHIEAMKPKVLVSTSQVLTPKKLGSRQNSSSSIQKIATPVLPAQKEPAIPDDDDDDFGDFASASRDTQPLGTSSASTNTNTTFSHMSYSTNTSISPIPLKPKKNNAYIPQRSSTIVPSKKAASAVANNYEDNDDDFGDFTSTATSADTTRPTKSQKEDIRNLVNMIPNMDSFL